MNKENKLLVIFASVFLVLGLGLSFGIKAYNTHRIKEKTLEKYAEVVPQASKIKISKIKKNEFLTAKYEFFDSSGIPAGKLYFGKGYAVGIYYQVAGEEEKAEYDKNQKYYFEIEVFIKTNDTIGSIIITNSEHTEEFVRSVENYFGDLLGTKLFNYKEVDEVAGASRFTMPIVRGILTEVAKTHLGKDPLPKPEAKPHEQLFGKGAVAEIDSSFVASEFVKTKEAVKDTDGNLVGYAYFIEGEDALHNIPYKNDSYLSILVGIDLEGKIVGIITLDTSHTQSGNYYGKILANFEELKGLLVKDAQIDASISGATISRDLVTKFINDLKGVIGNE